MAHRIPVLIAGGGPVGLALAVELGWRGIACELVEQTDGALTTPKMNEVNTRTMEFCRRWGIADQVLNCPFPGDHPLDAVFVNNLSGYELGRVIRPARNNQTPEPYSPYRLQACSQHWFDPMLQRLARSFPNVRLHHRHRLESFAQTPDGVTAEITDLASGARRQVTADFMVGCDGAGSQVRRDLGIELVGKGTIGNPINIFFRSPNLLERCGRKPGTFHLLVDSSGLWGNLRIIETDTGLWRLMVDNTNGTVMPESVDREAYLRRAIGRPIEVEWVEVNIWHRRSVVAERYGDGRVLLAGDAVHQVSPTGALGMNTGIGDAVDLGWKLAAVFDGWGGAKLIESYNDERQPVGARNVNMATGFYLKNEAFGQWDPKIEEDSVEGEAARRQFGAMLERGVGGEFRTIGAQLGYRYENSPICVTDGSPNPPDETANYIPNARPGARAPHAWLRDGRTILDLFGRGYVLLRFAGAPATSAIETAAAERNVPLQAIDLDEPEAAALYERQLVLVRPDGHVAWRADNLPADAGAFIDRVRGAN